MLVLFHVILVLKLSLGRSFHAGLTQPNANTTVKLCTSFHSMSYFRDLVLAQSAIPDHADGRSENAPLAAGQPLSFLRQGREIRLVVHRSCSTM